MRFSRGNPSIPSATPRYRVKTKYGLTVDRAEMEALAAVLAELETVIRMQSFGSLKRSRLELRINPIPFLTGL